jgi:hypothetical protein
MISPDLSVEAVTRTLGVKRAVLKSIGWIGEIGRAYQQHTFA